VINTVYNILKTLNVPVKYIVRPDIKTSKIGLSYHFFNEGYELYADGKGKEFGGSLQVDIFSTIDYSSIVRQSVELLENNGFRLADSRDSYDSLSNNIQYYQKTLIFNYEERMVQNGS
jgi:hypothetical protein